MTEYVYVEQVEKLFNEGYKKIVVTRSTGENDTLRLFKSGGSVAYYRKGSKRWGYSIRDLHNVVAVRPVKSRTAVLSGREKYLENYRKFKKTFAEKCHPNLWTELQDGYKNLNVDAFNAYMVEHKTPDYEMWKAYYEYEKEVNPVGSIIHENHYKIGRAHV
jgi:hypothetical protein